GQATTLHQLGRIAQEQRRWDEAESFYRQSLALSERIGNEHTQSGSLHQLGRIAEDQGNAAQALVFYQRAEEILDRLQDPHGLAFLRKSIERVQAQPPRTEPPDSSPPPGDPERSS